MNHSTLQKFYFALIWLSISLFVAQMLAVAFYYQPAADDFFFIHILKDHSIADSVNLQFFNQNSRFVSVFFTHLLIHLQMQTPLFFVLFYVVLLTIAGFSVYLLLNAAECRFGLNISHKILKSFFLISCAYYCTIGNAEVWMWMSSVSGYLMNIIFLTAGSALLLHKSKRWYVYLGGIVCFIYVGGASELSVIFVFIIFSSFLLIPYFNKTLSDYFKSTAFGLTFLVSFLILLTGTGFSNRAGSVDSMPIAASLLVNFKYCGIIVLQKLPQVIIPILLTIFIIAAPPVFQRNQHNNQLKIAKLLFLLLLIPIGLYCYQLIFTMFTSDVIPARALFPFIILSIIYLGVLFSHLPSIKKIYSFKPTLPILIIFMLLFQIYFLAINFPKTIQYVRAYDDRMTLIQSEQNKTESIHLEALPESGFLYSADITTDTNNFKNRHLQLLMDLKYPPILD